MRDIIWRKEFTINICLLQGLWNLIIGIPILILSYFTNPGLSLVGLLNYQLWFYAVILFGIGYYTVGKNIDKNHIVIALGATGKIIVFIHIIAYFLINVIDITYFIAGIGDLIFAILFIEFLVNYKKL